MSASSAASTAAARHPAAHPRRYEPEHEQEPKQEQDASFSSNNLSFSPMSHLSALLQNLTPPRILLGPHPSLRCAVASGLPARARLRGDLDQQQQASAVNVNSSTMTTLSASSWADYALAVDPSRLINSFSHLLNTHTSNSEQSTSHTSKTSCNVKDDDTSIPRVVWFGEQHHQSGVLKAQMQLLDALCHLPSNTPDSFDNLQSSLDSSEKPLWRASDQSSLSTNATTTTTTTSSTNPSRSKVSLVLEAFSLKDQPLLDLFQSSHLSISDLTHFYSHYSKENFDLLHFAPLLTLAKERGVRIWAGFPPRDWAAYVMKRDGEGAIGALGRWEQERYGRMVRGLPSASSLRELCSSDDVVSDASSTTLHGQHAEQDPSPTLPAQIWQTYSSLRAEDRQIVQPIVPFQLDERMKAREKENLSTIIDQIYKLSHAHQTFLSSLFRPDEPPSWPSDYVVSRSRAEEEISRLGKVEQEAYRLRLHQSREDEEQQQMLDVTLLEPMLHRASKGFGPAQAVKDTFLAGVVDQILGPVVLPCSALRKTGTNEAQASCTNMSERVLVIAGSGHLEYSLGAPERLRDLRRARYTIQQSAAAAKEKRPKDAKAILEERLWLENKVEKSLLILSKPKDSGVWGVEVGSMDEQARKGEMGSSHAMEHAETASADGERRDPRLLRSASLTGWESLDGWERPLADAVVLYDWVEHE
ncbi:hypothetical protein CBOM_02926 [Ceraceosorus bombacis]|uniref:Haem-binding uptake Tiki superfamily ChaN domain-containing protein n=1 Tax=Ceraceosorus bombacis TaxID=401625 RepID=A0A0P1BH88_9BASI|nr:hypothetical protein CBOM_02926 [Ceraceosorus bombacis]